MKNVVLKITIIIFVTLMYIFSINNISYADDSLTDVIMGGRDFIADEKNGNVSIDSQSLKDASSDIYNILLMVSFVVVAVVGIILGIKFMMAGVEEKAEVKKSLLIYVIGCIVVYGAYGIWKVLVSFLNTI